MHSFVLRNYFRQLFIMTGFQETDFSPSESFRWIFTLQNHLGEFFFTIGIISTGFHEIWFVSSELSRVKFLYSGIILAGFHEIWFLPSKLSRVKFLYFGIISVGFHEIWFVPSELSRVKFLYFGIISVVFHEMKFFALRNYLIGFFTFGVMSGQVMLFRIILQALKWMSPVWNCSTSERPPVIWQPPVWLTFATDYETQISPLGSGRKINARH
jgi:TRAP-type C4-dicarboxylate transport system permease large subunit